MKMFLLSLFLFLPVFSFAENLEEQIALEVRAKGVIKVEKELYEQFQKDIKYIQNETERHLSNQDYFDREAAQQLKRFKLGLSVLVFTIFIIILFFINQSSFFTLFVTILFGLLGINKHIYTFK
jgi:hypothetical protein